MCFLENLHTARGRNYSKFQTPELRKNITQSYNQLKASTQDPRSAFGRCFKKLSSLFLELLFLRQILPTFLTTLPPKPRLQRASAASRGRQRLPTARPACQSSSSSGSVLHSDTGRPVERCGRIDGGFEGDKGFQRNGKSPWKNAKNESWRGVIHLNQGFANDVAVDFWTWRSLGIV